MTCSSKDRIESESHSVMLTGWDPHGLYSPWNSPGQNTGLGSCSLLQLPSGTRNWIEVSYIAGRFFTSWTTREALWPPDVKSWFIWKDPDAGKDWGQEEKGMTEDEMVGRHHRLNGHEFEQALGVRGGQGGLVCCSPGVRKELDWVTKLNWTEEANIGLRDNKYLNSFNFFF